MSDAVFLYDQVIEQVARLQTFCSTREIALSAGEEAQDDVIAVISALAKRDLLTMAATARNLSESVRPLEPLREIKIATAELSLRDSPPFFKEKDQLVTMYQCLSRVLHAGDTKILRSKRDYDVLLSRTEDELLDRIFDGSPRELAYQLHEPLVLLSTKKEGLTLVRMQDVLSGTCKFLNIVSDLLAEQKIFVSRDIRF
jgi:hypothetical protein